MVHGRFAQSYDELHRERHGEPFGRNEKLISWVVRPAGISVNIAKSPHMPGYFMIGEDGGIHFNEDREATSEDQRLNWR